MPIYEYRCDQGHTFEVMQRISDDAPVVTCTTCSAPVQRVFRPIAVHFKGSGFYNTDYGTRKRAREKENGGGGEGKPAEGAETKSGSGADGGAGKSDSSKSSSDSGKKTETKKTESSGSASASK